MIQNLQYLKHLRSDSGADRTYHARDTAGRARTGTRIEILKNAMFGTPNFLYTLSPEETPFRGLRWITGRKNGSIRKEQYLSYVAYSYFAIYVCSNRPVKLRSLPRLDPRTGVRSTSAGCYCRSKCRTRWISYWLFAKTSLDPTEY